MAFRMRSDQALSLEARRIADKQLQLALAGLAAPHGTNGDRRIHTARRHVKKVRALIRLLQPRIASGERQRQRRLRAAERLLGAIADSEALVRTLDTMSARYSGALAHGVTIRLRAALRARERHVRQVAEVTGALRAAAAHIAAERNAVREWELADDGVAVVTRGLRRTARRARRGMRRALDSPTTPAFGIWRRRVKDLWFQMRLIEGYTGGAFVEDQHRLEQLDGVLGEIRNCALLAATLADGVLDSRPDTAQCLRVVCRYRHDLHRQARELAPLAHSVTPRRFATGVECAWHPVEAVGRASVTPWPRTASAS